MKNKLALRLALLSFLIIPSYAQLTAISGSFKNPDTTAVNGKLVVFFSRSTMTLLPACGTQQIVAFKTITVRITNGTMGALSLYAQSCISPNRPYTVRVYDSANNQLYTGQWVVPNTGTADVSALDTTPGAPNVWCFMCRLNNWNVCTPAFKASCPTAEIQ